MKVVLRFLRGLATLHPFWRVWVAILAAVNGLAPLFFLDTDEARAVLDSISFVIDAVDVVRYALGERASPA